MLITLPAGEAPSRLLANVCRKLLSDEELLLLLPPRAFTRLAKLVCKVESAELAVVLPLVEPDEADWACRAAIRACMNCWSASAALVVSGLEEVAEDEVAEDVDDDEVAEALLLESVALEDVVPSTPIDWSAAMRALIKLPPGGGGGGGVLPVEFVELVELVEPVLDVPWVWLRYQDGSHAVELDSELTLMLVAPDHSLRLKGAGAPNTQAMFWPKQVCAVVGSP
jgi:hypothetical protein